MSTVYVWGYGNRHPIAEIVGCTYEQLLVMIPENELEAIEARTTPTNQQLNKVNNLRALLPNSLVTTLQYKDLVGVSKATDPMGHVTWYEYDGLGRLTAVKDDGGNLLNTYQYNFSNKEE